MLIILQHLGLSPRMYRWREALYAKPSAQVQVTGTLLHFLICLYIYIYIQWNAAGMPFISFTFCIIPETPLSDDPGQSSDAGH